jgi:hypothetical protein
MERAARKNALIREGSCLCFGLMLPSSVAGAIGALKRADLLHAKLRPKQSPGTDLIQKPESRERSWLSGS